MRERQLSAYRAGGTRFSSRVAVDAVAALRRERVDGLDQVRGKARLDAAGSAGQGSRHGGAETERGHFYRGGEKGARRESETTRGDGASSCGYDLLSKDFLRIVRLCRGGGCGGRDGVIECERKARDSQSQRARAGRFVRREARSQPGKHARV